MICDIILPPCKEQLPAAPVQPPDRVLPRCVCVHHQADPGLEVGGGEGEGILQVWEAEGGAAAEAPGAEEGGGGLAGRAGEEERLSE